MLTGAELQSDAVPNSWGTDAGEHEVSVRQKQDARMEAVQARTTAQVHREDQVYRDATRGVEARRARQPQS